MDERQTKQLGDFLNSQGGSVDTIDETVDVDDAGEGVDEDDVYDEDLDQEDDVYDDDLDDVDDEGEEGEEEEKGSKGVLDTSSEIEALRAEIAALKNARATQPEPKPEEEEKFEMPNLEDLATEEELEEALHSPKALKALLAKTVNRTYETFLRDTPKLVSRHAQRQVILTTVINDFKKANKDLVENPRIYDYLRTVANRVEAENPSMPPDQILKTAAEQVRKDLKIQKRAKEVNSRSASQGGKKPRFAGRGKGQRNRGGEQKLSPEQSQIQAMLNAGR